MSNLLCFTASLISFILVALGASNPPNPPLKKGLSYGPSYTFEVSSKAPAIIGIECKLKPGAAPPHQNGALVIGLALVTPLNPNVQIGRLVQNSPDSHPSKSNLCDAGPGEWCLEFMDTPKKDQATFVPKMVKVKPDDVVGFDYKFDDHDKYWKFGATLNGAAVTSTPTTVKQGVVKISSRITAFKTISLCDNDCNKPISPQVYSDFNITLATADPKFAQTGHVNLTSGARADALQTPDAGRTWTIHTATIPTQ